MTNKLEIITTSISPSTNNMMPCSVNEPASVTRCANSFINRNTYTHWATINPRYNGSCSQRDAKMSLESGLIVAALIEWSEPIEFSSCLLIKRCLPRERRKNTILFEYTALHFDDKAVATVPVRYRREAICALVDNAQT